MCRFTWFVDSRKDSEGADFRGFEVKCCTKSAKMGGVRGLQIPLESISQQNQLSA
jgi:hypothetical protein